MPRTIEEVLAGPHMRTLVNDGEVNFVLAEPLRVIPIVRVRGRDVALGGMPHRLRHVPTLAYANPAEAAK